MNYDIRRLSPKTVSVPEAAKLLNYSPTTVRTLIRDGKIHAVRPPRGNAYRVNLASVQIYKAMK